MAMTRPLLRRRAGRALSTYVKLRGGRPFGEVFDAARVERMLRSGESEEAHYYLHRFLTRVTVKDMSPLSSDLLNQVGLFKILATVARGGEDAAVLASMFAELNEEHFRESPACLRQNQMILRMHANPRWAYKVWQHVDPVQVKKIMEAISSCPDLQGDVRLLPKRVLSFEPTARGLCASALAVTGREPTAWHQVLSFVKSYKREFVSGASSSTMFDMKNEQIAPKPINLAAGVPSNASSSSLVLDTQLQENAP